MKIKKLIYLTLLTILVVSSYAQDTQYGLIFNSKDTAKERKTSFSVPSDSPFKLNEPMTLDFKFTSQSKNKIFGYIARVVINDTINFDIISTNDSEVMHPYLRATSKGNILLSFNDLYRDERTINNIKLRIDPLKDSVFIDINGLTTTVHTEIPDNSECQILFGTNNTKKFYTTDIAPIIIRDISFQIGSKKPYLWKMDKHGKGFTIDENYGAKLEIKNDNWLLDKHLTWKNLWNRDTPYRMHTVFDDDHTLYIVTREGITSYDFITKEVKTINTGDSFLSGLQSSSIIYDHKYKTLRYLYLDKDEQSTSLFDFETERWNPTVKDTKLSKHLHSNLISSPRDSSILQFFGYGYFKYKSSLFSYKDGSYDLQSLSPPIKPRYLAAMGVNADTAYIFGGIGNLTGVQELGTEVFNDLYKYDFSTNKASKVWDMHDAIHTEVAAKNIIINPDNPNKGLSLFYTPINNVSYLVLKEIDLREPKISAPKADTLVYNFHDVRSEAQLFYVKGDSKLYAVITHRNPETEKYKIRIFNINYPILQESDVFLDEPKSSEKKSLFFVLLAILSSCLLFAVVYFKRKKEAALKASLVTSTQADELEDLEGTTSKTEPITRELVQDKHEKQAGVYLLGGFTVINRDHIDITKEFTPIMKQLLALIIIYTNKNGKGISNNKTKELLWFDKSDTSAQNNRNVNISKIRNILQNVGDFALVSENSYWRITYSQTDFCDYIYAQQKLNTVSSMDSGLACNTIKDIANFGELLPNQNADFFDQYKAEYSDLIISTAQLQIQKTINKHDIISLASTILIFDKTDEEALKIKCKTLIEIGKNGIAKTTYDNFTREYKTLFDSKYEVSFEEIVG
ncbi:MAG: kelch repeat-containing protein [Rikenellaceae bacterium]